MTRSTRVGPIVLVAAVTALATGCSTRAADPDPSGGMASMGPVLSVERFLQAANARDFSAMRRLFGTADGPIKGPEREIELRMATIAEILRHQDYRIVSEQMAPGREHPTNRIGVTITRGGEVVRDVPFMVVRTSAGHWLVEQIDLEKITSS